MRTFAPVLLLFVATLMIAGCDHGDQSAMAMPARPPAPVVAVPAVAKDVPVYIDEIGSTVARENVTIRPQVIGKVLEIHFEDGVELKKGDKLFTIDPRPYLASLQSAEASLAQSNANLKWAQSELARVEELRGTGAVSAQEAESKRNAVTVADAQVKSSEAAIVTAKLNVEYCTITSPIEGRAGQRLVDIGNVVSTGAVDGGTAMLVIQRQMPIYVDFTIPEQQLGPVRQQMASGILKVSAWLPTDPSEVRDGTLTFLDNAVKDASGTIKLRGTLPNEDRYFWPGQFVNVRLVLTTKKDAVLVPAQAQQIGQQGPYVYVVKAGEIEDPATKKKQQGTLAELRPIKLGQRQGDHVVIDSGVTVGEQVITVGQNMVMPGGPVVVTPPAGVAPTPATQAVAEGAPKS